MSNPFSVFVDIFLNDGSRASTQDAMRLQAFDVEGTAVTFLGELWPSTTERQQIEFTHAPNSYPNGREYPNVKIEIVNSSSLVVHNTQVFSLLRNESVIEIVIGEGESLLGRWTISGTVTSATTGQVVQGGEVEVLQIDGNRFASAGKAVVNLDGQYSLTIVEQFAMDDPAWNQPRGPEDPVPPLLDDPPIYVVRYTSLDGAIQAQSEPASPDSQEVTIDLGANSVPVVPGSYVVRGGVTNLGGAPLPGVVVEAFQLFWTASGVQEVSVGRVATSGDGAYEIQYSPAIAPATTCSSNPGEVNLVVKLREGTVEAPGFSFGESDILAPAQTTETVNLVADRAAELAQPDFERIESAFKKCLTGDDVQIRAILVRVRDEPGYRAFTARVTSLSASDLLAFARAVLIAHEINTAIPFGIPIGSGGDDHYDDYPIFSAQLSFALIQGGLGESLQKQLQVEPPEFLEAITTAMRSGQVSLGFEAELNPSSATNRQSQWALVRAYFLGSVAGGATYVTDDSKLLALAITSEANRLALLELTSQHKEGLFEAVDAASFLSAAEKEDVKFVFQFYAIANEHFPIVQVVYGSKAARAWTSVEDLVDVGIRADSNGDGWTEFALAQVPIGGFPIDIYGRTDLEKATFHARKLQSAIREAFPQGEFTQEAGKLATDTSDVALGEAVQFIKDNPDFNLETTSINRYLTNTGKTLSTDGLAKLKQLQRVRRMTSHFDAARALIDKGLDSSFAITEIEEGEFIADNEQLVGGYEEAQAIYKRASEISAEVSNLVLRFQTGLNDAGGATSMGGGASLTAALTEVQSLKPHYANYAELFGNVFSCASRHCETVLSPAAYLVDLLQFLQGLPLNVLSERRPDLLELELNCENTDVVFPYIDLVIEQLSQLIAPYEATLRDASSTLLTAANLNAAADGDAIQWDHVKASILSDVEVPLTDAAVIKKVLDQQGNPKSEWVIEDKAIRYRVKGNDVSGYMAVGTLQTSGDSTALEVFPEHSSPRAERVLEGAFFPFDLPLALGRREVELVLERLNLRRAAALLTLRQQSAPYEVPGFALYDADLAPAYLSLTSNEQKGLLNAVDAQTSAAQFWGFTNDLQQSIPRPEAPHRIIIGSWLELLAEVSVFLDRSGLTYKQLQDLLEVEFIHDASSHIEIDPVSEENASECNYHEFRLVNLTESAALRVNVFLRVFRKLGWSMQEVDRYLTLVENPGLSAPYNRPSNVVQLAGFEQIRERLGLSVFETLALFVNLDGESGDRLGPSMFSRLVLKGNRAAPGYVLLQSLEKKGALEVVSVVDEEMHQSVQSVLRIALRLSRADFDELWNALGYPVLPPPLTEPPTPADPYDLTKAMVSDFVRHAFLFKALGLSAEGFFEARTLLGIDPFAGGGIDMQARTSALAQAISEITLFQSGGLELSAVPALLAAPDTSDLAATQQQYGEVLASLSAAALEIEGKYGLEAPPASPENLGTLLAELMPQDKVPSVLNELTPSPGETPGIETMKRYFVAFIEESQVESFINNDLMSIVDETERRKLLLVTVRDFLLFQARAKAAVTIAGEIIGANKTRTEYLLNLALSSVVGNDDAAGDWVAGVGAFETDFSQLVGSSVGASEVLDARWIAPADGEVRFFVQLDLTGITDVQAELQKIQISVDGQALTPSLDLTVGTMLFEPITVKQGDVRQILVSSTSDNQFALRARQGNGDPAALSPTWFSTFPQAALIKWTRVGQLLNGLDLDVVELEALRVRDEALAPGQKVLDGVGQTSVPWTNLRAFLVALQAHRSIRLEGTSLFEFIDAGETIAPADIAELTEWEVEDITLALAQQWTSFPGFQDAAVWLRLHEAMTLTQKLEQRFARVRDLLLDVPSSTVARGLRERLQATYSQESWSNVFKGPRDELRRIHRNALAGYLTAPPAPVGSDEPRFASVNELFAHLLIDVEMEPDVQISRLKLALNAIQLFVQRIFLGVEKRKPISAPTSAHAKLTLFDSLAKKQEQWEWMKNYRVWEANRKVFLWPENWIEPQLRDDKTKLFEAAEDQIMQDDLDDARAQQVLSSYLSDLQELTQLTVIGITKGGGTTYYLARDRARPHSYYYRTSSTSGFGAWIKVDVEIEAPFVVPVVVAGTLRLIWPMIIEKNLTIEQESAPSSSGEQPTEVKEKRKRIFPEVLERFFKPVQQAAEKVEIQENKDGEKSAKPIHSLSLMWTTLDAATSRWSKPRAGTSELVNVELADQVDTGFQQDGPDTRGYHLQASASAVGDVTVEVIATRVVGPLKEVLEIRPRRLGFIDILRDGEDIARPSSKWLDVGAYYSYGSLLINNVAEQVPVFEVVPSSPSQPIQVLARPENVSMYDRFYFKAVPGEKPYRLIAPNARFFGGPADSPMVLEVGGTQLLGQPVRSQKRQGLQHGTIEHFMFETFGYPVMSQVAAEHKVRGPDGIMNRLTQALPTSKGQGTYAYGYGNNTSTYGGGYSGYGGVYLGYYIADDHMARGIANREFRQDFQPVHPLVEQRGPDYPFPTVQFTYGTPYGAYNWELFFHLPILIADRLAQQMRFSDALKWFHYVFDPRGDLNDYERPKKWARALPAGARFWNFLPFFANKDVQDSLLDVFGVTAKLNSERQRELEQVISAWRNNPFSPHLIARQRIAAYQKSTVLKYLDTLIGWGDQLFRQDSFESINEATQLYVLAADLLGKRPEVIEPLHEQQRMSYTDLRARGLSPFSNSTVSNALKELETIVSAKKKEPGKTPPKSSAYSPSSAYFPSASGAGAGNPGEEYVKGLAYSSLFFAIPRNERLDRYWDTVADRLFKIRNSLNIDGVKRTLALFQPPIDPALLVRARAAGLDLSAAISQLNQPLPHYRYNVWIGQAKELANELKSFSSAILAALEKSDAEQLALIRQDQEIRLLKKVRDVRRAQIKEAEQNLVALQARREMPLDRIQQLRSREHINSSERASLALTRAAQGLDFVAGIMNHVGSGLSAIPQFHAAVSPATEFGGQHLGAIFNSVGISMSTKAGAIRTEASVASTNASYERRQEDWDLQISQAELELKDIDEQILAAEIRIDIANKELENHELQIEQSEEIQTFYKDKFTSRELYQWMITQLSRTFQQTYRLAYDVAKTAERAFQFELGIDDSNFVQFEYRDSLRKGLLAGEKLYFDLKRMEVAYLEKDRREFELTKPISLAALNPAKLQELRELGSCTIEIPEVLFDLDHPGQYFRRIQGVRLTIPCVTGPYTNVSAKLSLLSSTVRVQSTTDPNDYPYKGPEDTRFVHDRRGIQSIATSTAQDDAGLFEFNFRDERYLPFEGAGAISRWRLELPAAARQFDYSTISDVILTMSYTARDAGGSLLMGFQNSWDESINRILRVMSETQTGLSRVFSLKREFPDALHQLVTTGETSLGILRQHFPYLLRTYPLAHWTDDQNAGQSSLRVFVQSTATVPGLDLQVKLNEEPFATGTYNWDVNRGGAEASLLVVSPSLFQNELEEWVLRNGDTPTPLSGVDDVLLEVKYVIPESQP